MTVTVIDSSNLEQIMADAGVEVAEPPKTEEKANTKEPEAKDEPKSDADGDPKGKETETADEQEDDDGLTPSQKQELSAKIQKAIGKKHRQAKEAEEFAAHQYREKQAAEQRAAELERRVKSLEAQNKPAEAPQERTKPARENFATDTDFIEAMADWKAEEKFNQKEAERRELETKSRISQQLARAAGMVPDFDEVTGRGLNWPAPVAHYLRDSEMFAELGYHFAKNPADLERIGKLDPVRQLVAVGKIEGTLRPFGSKDAPKADSPKEAADEAAPNGKAAKAAPSTPETGFSPSKARSDAPVIKPLSAGDGQQVQPDPHDMDVRQMIADFQRKKGVNLSHRKRH